MSEQNYKNTGIFESQHQNPPPPFNPDFREGYKEEHNKRYMQWNDENPNSTRDQRGEAYRRISVEITPLFPSVAEKGEYRYKGKSTETA